MTVKTKSTIKTKRTMVTPRMASKWLEMNTSNRNLRKQVVELYASDIKAGRWLFTGDAIRFNCDGTLIDGQHRLAAIVKADTPIESMVISGLPKDIQIVVDTGTPRRLSDALKLSRGVPHYLNAVASTVRWATRMEAGTIDDGGGYGKKSLPAELEWFDAHPDTYDYAVWAFHLKKKYRLPIITPAIMAGMRLLAGEDEQLVKMFFEDVMSGEYLSEGDPQLALRRWLERRGASSFSTGRKALAAVTIKAYNAFVAGAPVAKLNFNPKSKVPAMVSSEEM